MLYIITKYYINILVTQRDWFPGSNLPLNPPFASFCKVDRLHGDNESGKFTVTLETACCDVPDYGQIQGALSDRFGVNWLLVILATCGIPLDKFPSGQHVLLINDKELFYQHMRGANLYVQVSDGLR